MTPDFQTEPAAPPVAVAVCSRHPTERSLDACKRCGDYVCFECIKYEEGEAYCLQCAPFSPPLADVGARFFGRLVDNLAYAAAAGIPGAIAWAAFGEELGVLVALLGFLALWSYNVYLLASSGQSVGKRFINTRIVTQEGGPVSAVRTVFLRTLLPVGIGSIPLAGNVFGVLDGLWIFGQRHRCLHDLLAGTIVVESELTEHVYARKG